MLTRKDGYDTRNHAKYDEVKRQLESYVPGTIIEYDGTQYYKEGSFWHDWIPMDLRKSSRSVKVNSVNVLFTNNFSGYIAAHDIPLLEVGILDSYIDPDAELTRKAKEQGKV